MAVQFSLVSRASLLINPFFNGSSQKGIHVNKEASLIKKGPVAETSIKAIHKENGHPRMLLARPRLKLTPISGSSQGSATSSSS